MSGHEGRDGTLSHVTRVGIDLAWDETDGSHDVTFVDLVPEHVDAIRAGLRITGPVTHTGPPSASADRPWL